MSFIFYHEAHEGLEDTVFSIEMRYSPLTAYVIIIVAGVLALPACADEASTPAPPLF
ncbi:hypothetical protein [Methylotuvimicrobium sp. KM2]|uniref:hypothetical protein n=1 Tax=Methylotuvimicrobium sp. KM2 TaxID=3133976 RepID=UPI003100C5AD